MRCLLILLVVLVCAIVVVLPVTAAESAQPVSVPTTVEQFDALFFSGLADIGRSDYYKASQQFEKLREVAWQSGYLGLPLFSEYLLNMARSLDDARKDTERAFIVKEAVKLAPKNPGVLLGASSFRSVLEQGEGWEFFIQGALASLSRPTFVGACLRNIFLVSLTALTLSLFLVCIIQLVAHRLSIVLGLGKLIPLRYRGFVAPVLLFVCLLLPLLMGPVAAAALWALMLSRYIRDCKGLGLFAGIIILSWPISIVIIERLDQNATSEISAAVESIENREFVPGAYQIVQSALDNYKTNASLLYAAGLSDFWKARYERATKTFAGLSTSQVSSSMALSAKISLGISYYYAGEYEKALWAVKDAQEYGAQSPEFFYFRAMIHMAMMQPDQHREYFSKANSMDVTRVKELEVAGDLLSQKLLPLPPFAERYHRLLVPAFADRNLKKVDNAYRGALLQSMLGVKSLSVAYFMGLAIICLGFLFWRRPIRLQAVEERLQNHELGVPSMIWILMPCGYLIRGKYSVLGVVVMSIIIGCVIATFGIPVYMLPVIPVVSMSKYYYLGTAVFITVVVGVLSIWAYPFKRSEVEPA